MPAPRGRNSAGRAHQHQRNLSGGSSKVGLNNLQLTQKDPLPSKTQQLKRAGNSAIDLHAGRTTSPFPRPPHLTANSRILSKERIATLQQKRTHTPVSTKRQPVKNITQTHKAGFSIAYSDGTDDEEWVSSESGAATPQNNDVDAARGSSPVDQQKGGFTSAHVGEGEDTTRASNGVVEPLTPRAESELALTRVETARPGTSVVQAQALAQPPTVRIQPQSTPAFPGPTPVPPSASERRAEVQLVRHTRSEAPSPTQLPQKPMAKRHPLVRHSSTHGDVKVEMPHHPLIRGQSYHGALKPAPLAPLTVNSETAQAQLSASPRSARLGSRTGSPSYSTQPFAIDSPTEASPDSHDRALSRKGSVSSLHSVATLPAPVLSRFGARSKQDRTRTLSTISMSSSSAALNSLNMLPAMSRPGTPPLAVHFPSESRHDVQDGYHQLLPPMYVPAHMTVLARINPLRDCYNRVMRAKHGL
ncbi:hypothetical protein EW145_g3118 [Phellinidium pouzarii]|uniref:Uncharacterized protein n=1 Tax=Phellinidium pouzarii TaxID=167371 RepID=A0A4S4L9U9_9AGAM|nr:hypothetical protein EW145_g3118 [Phellinidium pouzarii]